MVEPLSSLIRPHRGPVLPALERLAPPPPDNLVSAEIEARSAPGDVIVELHGRGGWVARSAVNRLRRVYDLESTALTRLVAEIVLRPPDLRHFDAALNALAVHPRGDVGLRQAVTAPFTSHCAACGRAVVVDEFIWDGDAPTPSRKAYRCTGCRSNDGRPVPVDAEDVERAQATDAAAARAFLADRFPAPDADASLPDQLLDLYTPRTLAAIAAIVERLDGDLRAQSIEASLRLALVHLLLPASRLSSYPGRVAALRISHGHVKPLGDRQWRERNPWLLFEDGCRTVRAFVQRLESSATGHIQARFGGDLGTLIDGAANVVLQQASAAARDGVPHLPRADEDLPGRLDPRSRLRLVLTQLPVHWTPENLSFAYLATSIALGREHAASLPLEAVFGSAPRGEWAWDAAALRRSLAGIAPILARDARVVLMLDRTGPGGLVAGVLGGAGAGYRLSGAILAESGDQIGGTLEFVPPWADVPDDRSQPNLPASLPPDEPFRLDAVEAAVSDVAVAVLQARGEPARFERLLGEVLIGLDRMGHLRNLVGTQTFAETEQRAEADAAAGGLFPGPRPPHDADEPPRPLVGIHIETSPSGNGRGLSWRDPLRHARAPMAVPIVPDEAEQRPEAVGVAAMRSDPGPNGSSGDGAAAQTQGTVDAQPTTLPEPPAPKAEAAPEPLGLDVPDLESTPDPSLEDPFATSEPIAAWASAGSGSDPVKLLLEIVMGELHRPEHPRLVELEPGRWWLRASTDVTAARPPLSDRLEWAVFSLLSTSGGMEEAAFFDRIAGMFRGHDTPDEELVRACLDAYRSSEPSPDGLIRTDDALQARYEEHGMLVGMLAEYGHRLGLRCWVSRREQRRQFKGAPLSELLSEAERRVYLPLVSNGAPEALEAVDCIWYLRGKATFLFEVEWTAMVDEAVLRRGPRIPSSDTLVRFLVVPAERIELVRLKLARSPLLRRRMAEDNWHILKAEHLRRLYAREAADLEGLGPLIGLDPDIERQGEQLALFA